MSNATKTTRLCAEIRTRAPTPARHARSTSTAAGRVGTPAPRSMKRRASSAADSLWPPHRSAPGGRSRTSTLRLGHACPHVIPEQLKSRSIPTSFKNPSRVIKSERGGWRATKGTCLDALHAHDAVLVVGQLSRVAVKGAAEGVHAFLSDRRTSLEAGVRVATRCIRPPQELLSACPFTSRFLNFSGINTFGSSQKPTLRLPHCQQTQTSQA